MVLNDLAADVFFEWTFVAMPILIDLSDVGPGKCLGGGVCQLPDDPI